MLKKAIVLSIGSVMTSLVLSGCGSSPTKSHTNIWDDEQGYIQAIHQSDLAYLKEVEKDGYRTNRNIRKDDSAFPIHYVIEQNKLDLIPFFVNQGYDINGQSSKFGTPLNLAVKTGNLDKVKAVVEAGADVNHLINGKVPLSYVDIKNVELAKYLIDKGANPFLVLRDLSTSVDQKRFLMQLSQPQSFSSAREFKYYYDLMIAVPNVKEIIRLDELNKDSQYKYFEKNSLSPIHIAVKKDLHNVLKDLVSNGFDVNRKVRGVSPLMKAVQEGKTASLKELLRLGADIDADGLKAIELALNNKNYEQSKLLIEAGLKSKLFSVQVLNKYLISAVNRGDYGFVESLLSGGANPKILNEKGMSLLHIIASKSMIANSDVDVLNLLIEKGANLNGLNDSNESAFYLSVKNNHTGLIQALLDKKANIRNGKLAYELAKKENNTFVAKLYNSNYVSKAEKAEIERQRQIEARNKTRLKNYKQRMQVLNYISKNLITPDLIHTYYLLRKQKNQSYDDYSAMANRYGGTASSRYSGGASYYSKQDAANELMNTFLVLAEPDSSASSMQFAYDSLIELTSYREARAGELRSLLLKNESLLRSP